MNHMEAYSRYVEQEDRYYKQLKTLEDCQCAIFEHVYRYGNRFDKRTAEDVLINIHQLEDEVRVELLQVRLEKAYLAHAMNRNEQSTTD